MGVQMRVGSKYRAYQSIIIEVMKVLMDNMEVAVKGAILVLERRDLTKGGGGG